MSASDRAEGYQNWTVECRDVDGNYQRPTGKHFTVDQSPPNITLEFPDNNSDLDANSRTIRFSWKATDAYDNSLYCPLS